MDLNRVQMFAQVVEQGSFTKAAKVLGITKATVSRKIAELEADVGVQLLFRTTRALKLTEAGANYYNRVHHILSRAAKCRRSTQCESTNHCWPSKNYLSNRTRPALLWQSAGKVSQSLPADNH